MKILITGNLGYVGSVVTPHLAAVFPEAQIDGLDIGLFAHMLSTSSPSPETKIHSQIFTDIRDIDIKLLRGYDIVIHLAAISNDPIGNSYEGITDKINYEATLKIARNAKEAGVSSFIYASSCSVYGYQDDTARRESSSLAPLTAYARSKIASEEMLSTLADNNFLVTCHRFATACGASPRLRLDLVVNDFVFRAVTEKKIQILSDGTPWRPLISVQDMAKAVEWSCRRQKSDGGSSLILNTGSDKWNFQVRDIAKQVQMLVPDCEIDINENAAPDKRSYKVDFSLYKELAPEHYPDKTISTTLQEIVQSLQQNFVTRDFDEYVRLKTIQQLISEKRLSADFRWLHA